MSKVKIIVQFSGGKESQACLIKACETYGAENVTAIFCDTGWEHELTYKHINDIVNLLGVELVILKNNKVDGMVGLCRRMNWLPDTKNRMCTVQLKVYPMIDWILAQDEHLIILQGIRAKESAERAKFDVECSYFKDYFDTSVKKQLYRKRDVRNWCSTHDASVLRPIFSWSAQQVIDYILSHGQRPNPLYERGASRVGCFPCIFARLNEIKIVARDDKYKQRVVDLENAINSKRDNGNETTFFCKGKIPARFCHQNSNGAPTFGEVSEYVLKDENQPTLWDETEPIMSCVSLYHGLCE